MGMGATCPNCGRGIEGQERFCNGCGTFLGWEAGEPGESQPAPQEPPQRDDQRAAVHLQIKSELIKVTPGNAESTAFTVKNLGTRVEAFRLTVTGPDWITVEPATISVYPGQEGMGTVQVAPPRQPSSAAGVTPFQLTVTSTLHADVSGSVAGQAEVAPFYELAAELLPSSSSGRRWTRHHITLDNRGNVALRVELKPADVADGLRISAAAFADVAPGTVTSVPVAVYGAPPLFGRPEPKTFSIVAEAPKPLAATRLTGTRVVLPLFPRWVPLAAAGLLAAAVVAVALVPKLTHRVGSLPGNVAASTPANGGAASTPANGGGASTPPNGGGASTPPNGNSAPQAYDMITAASGATWTSFSPAGQPTLQVQQNAGCQPGAGAGQGAVFSLTAVQMDNGTTASRALETDPPGRPSASVVGVYQVPATPNGATFQASVGFCLGAAGDQMQYQVFIGSQPSSQAQTVNDSTGALTPVKVNLPAGTTQIQLRVSFPTTGTSADDFVWVDPRIVYPAS
jgi:hypothetical protein